MTPEDQQITGGEKETDSLMGEASVTGGEPGGSAISRFGAGSAGIGDDSGGGGDLPAEKSESASSQFKPPKEPVVPAEPLPGSIGSAKNGAPVASDLPTAVSPMASIELHPAKARHKKGALGTMPIPHPQPADEAPAGPEASATETPVEAETGSAETPATPEVNPVGTLAGSGLGTSPAEMPASSGVDLAETSAGGTTAPAGGSAPLPENGTALPLEPSAVPADGTNSAPENSAADGETPMPDGSALSGEVPMPSGPALGGEIPVAEAVPGGDRESMVTAAAGSVASPVSDNTTAVADNTMPPVPDNPIASVPDDAAPAVNSDAATSAQAASDPLVSQGPQLAQAENSAMADSSDVPVAAPDLSPVGLDGQVAPAVPDSNQPFAPDQPVDPNQQLNQPLDPNAVPPTEVQPLDPTVMPSDVPADLPATAPKKKKIGLMVAVAVALVVVVGVSVGAYFLLSAQPEEVAVEPEEPEEEQKEEKKDEEEDEEVVAPVTTASTTLSCLYTAEEEEVELLAGADATAFEQDYQVTFGADGVLAEIISTMSITYFSPDIAIEKLEDLKESYELFLVNSIGLDATEPFLSTYQLAEDNGSQVVVQHTALLDDLTAANAGVFELEGEVADDDVFGTGTTDLTDGVNSGTVADGFLSTLDAVQTRYESLGYICEAK